MEKILNPISHFSDKTLIKIGFFGTILGIILGFYFNGNYDGALDLHFVEKTSWLKTILNNFISISSATIMFFICGKIINPKTRLIDILLVVSISRIPLYLLNFLNTNEFTYRIRQKITESIPKINQNPKVITQVLGNDFVWFAITIFFSLTIIALTIAILFNGFKVATNLKKSNQVFYFVLALILAEIISKIIISFTV
jgi:hypothetical protein